MFYTWRPYVSVAGRRARAARMTARLKKEGRSLSPVEIAGRTIARTFWGKAWCANLERYGDFSNRLPRGRAYARNGSVIDLQVGAGEVRALVSGSEIYSVLVAVAPLPADRWRALCRECAGGIDSLVELLQGRFSAGVMARFCKEGDGLFPSPQEIHFSCSCPDWAYMCKHVAAALYGVGARLDAEPELLFRLRGVDEKELIATAGSGLPLAGGRPAAAKVLAGADLAEMFGLELAGEPEPGASDGERPEIRRIASKKAAAILHVAGPAGAGKTTFVTAVLRGLGGTFRVLRGVRDDALPAPEMARPRSHPELKRFRWAGAPGASVFRFPGSTAGAGVPLALAPRRGASQPLLLEGDLPFPEADLEIVVLPPPPRKPHLDRTEGIERADLVVVNVREAGERARGARLVEEVRRRRREGARAGDSGGGEPGAVVADLTSLRDPGTRQALARVRRAIGRPE